MIDFVKSVKAKRALLSVLFAGTILTVSGSAIADVEYDFMGVKIRQKIGEAVTILKRNGFTPLNYHENSKTCSPEVHEGASIEICMTPPFAMRKIDEAGSEFIVTMMPGILQRSTKDVDAQIVEFWADFSVKTWSAPQQYISLISEKYPHLKKCDYYGSGQSIWAASSRTSKKNSFQGISSCDFSNAIGAVISKDSDGALSVRVSFQNQIFQESYETRIRSSAADAVKNGIPKDYKPRF
ncbi:hypothetical protein [Azospirillum sp. B506]|uniref:hypothetical protein n=1 Tax=Azospirillum sp. B506 TaxID=137721 RepID=UPI0011DE3658|nr:hypothetical protein [Azospirillum sp. B506]